MCSPSLVMGSTLPAMVMSRQGSDAEGVETMRRGVEMMQRVQKRCRGCRSDAGIEKAKHRGAGKGGKASVQFR